MRHFSKLVSVLGLIAMASGVHASTQCTQEPKSKWMSESAMQDKVKQAGYQIKTFKVSGSCYEIYGTDKDGKKAEVYFNPVDGAIVKSK